MLPNERLENYRALMYVFHSTSLNCILEVKGS